MMFHHLGDKDIALNGIITIFTVQNKQKDLHFYVVCYYIAVKVGILWNIGTYD